MKEEVHEPGANITQDIIIAQRVVAAT
jgi:hypothetical protein